jgi:hypothetical protein
MPTFYIADEPEAFAYGNASEVAEPDIQSAAEDEAARLFDEEGVDPMRPVEVIVVTDSKGANTMRYSVSRHVEITHTIESETEIVVPLVEED